MYRLSSLIFLLALSRCLIAQSPHGESLSLDCSACHTAMGWDIPLSFWTTKVEPSAKPGGIGKLPEKLKPRFDHDSTFFALTGQHALLDCRACHQTLVFSEANPDCNTCHTDIHQQTVGADCARCHTTANWLVDNITSLHVENGFPLLGAHAAANCFDCHTSESNLRFDRIGNDCVNCHLADFQATTNPNHPQAGFSINCIECHDPSKNDWNAATVDHSFFPLEKGHDIMDCAACHTGGNYISTPTDCFACHQQDFESTTNPNHLSAGFSTTCTDCHTTDKGWSPANFANHDAQYFPIYSGAHNGVWMDCVECHTNPGDYKVFTCVSCHQNPETNNAHTGVNGYVYDDAACLACHPNGDANQVFDHNATAFPLTGSHIGLQCIECHSAGYAGTPTACAACHTDNYAQTANPNHPSIGISTDCATCHTTAAWTPADFPDHDSHYPLLGAHAAIANDCVTCHNGDYNNTPNTCVGCHQQDFNQTTSPDHAAGQFPTDCATCHNESAWVPSSFDHNSVWPLTGAHVPIANDCALCHIGGDYANTPNTCAGCHQQHYDQSTNPSHTALGIPTDCATCHTTNGWEPATFPIHDNYFVLNGAHAAAANDCAACHNGDYNNTPNSCKGCHLQDYNQTSNPNHSAAQFPTDCFVCHNETAWSPSTFNHDVLYPITGAHTAIANDCVQCHINGVYSGTPNTCVGCHQQDYNQTSSPDHSGAQFPTDCIVCHDQNAWVPASFNHDNYWPLTGQHGAIANECLLCHTNGNYANTPNTCAGCHQTDYNASTNPNHSTLGIPTDCESCHTTIGWSPAQFPIHDDFYPLNGAHAGIANACAPCHNGDYNNTPNPCASCHQTDYNQTSNPNHQASQFNTDCAVCHNESSWVPAIFDHDNQHFPIYSGAHQGEWSACVDCHTNPADYKVVSCTTCHTNPDTDNSHPGVNGYVYNSTACLACHPTGDASNIFDHNTTMFPLTGVHLTTQCLECHANGFANTPTDCVSCHSTDYNQSANPNHLTANIPTDCATCHTTSGWAPAQFPIHDNYYPITGAHAAIANDCAACHNGDYNNTPNTCVGCHQADFNGTTNPDHQAAQFPDDCTLCHSQSSWIPATFNHDIVWPLTGAHATVPNCTDCHIGGNYSNTSSDCVSCHQQDFDGTTNPNHSVVGIPTDCATCHTTSGWAPAQFPIHDNYYPITGAHTAIANDCAACHNGDYNNTPNTCVGCHQADYNGTTNPDHQAAQFPNDCTLCHSESAWVPSSFNHDNIWPLIEAHATVPNCTDCHIGGNYSNTPNTCIGCHQADFNGTTNPDHQAAQFPDDCTLCHTQSSWMPATFNHDAVWPLTGAHATVPNCTDCHIGGNYSNTSSDCVSCHQQDFDGSTNPNHSAIGIPTDCATCHTTDGWDPALFPIHDTYYQLNGAHVAIANDCAACHNGNYNNTPNTCVGCHQADYNGATNPDHQAAQFPDDCTLCHSESAWVPSSFNHDNIWPLTGAHATVPSCTDCHIGGNYSNTSSDCVSCHQQDFDGSTNPNHSAIGIPTDCATCHTTDAWDPALFPIHDTYYQLNGAHVVIANDCAACHNGNYNNTPNTCVGCHQADYDGTTNPDHQAAQFPTDCAQCHSESAWSPATFDHNTVWPLNGAHALVPNCTDCHIGGNYSNTPTNCVGCHQPDYNATSNPNHVINQFSTDCTQCHDETGCVPSTFDHNTVWPLTGAHALVPECIDCHTGGNYSNTPNTCVSCHQTDYNGTSNPSHTNLNIPTDCSTCHTPDGWIPASFPIHDNYYQLNGAHAIIADNCVQCHNGNYNNTPNTCVGCHLPDYNATTNPNHSTAGFPTNCTQCHDETAWVPSTFDHNTIWPLNGAHANVPNCTDCHVNGNYNNTPNTCVGCHLPNYNATTNPNHSAAGFGTNCTQCHDETAWVPSTFDHNTIWPLNGAHATVPNCTDCHINGNYNNTPTTCIGCHHSDYNGANNPNHSSAGFPTDCTLCHNETAWDPSTFNHDAMYFPIYSGKHKDEWNQCVECHTIPGNFSAFSCIDCHEHDNPQQVGQDHQGVNGYSYNSAACYSCHPDGND
ncbi:MAG: hypothetical protein IPL65_04445 [Lewinellaceae bacterium]|nr:hypothetical protein [Lewinellaceae bacterium]